MIISKMPAKTIASKLTYAVLHMLRGKTVEEFIEMFKSYTPEEEAEEEV